MYLGLPNLGLCSPRPGSGLDPAVADWLSRVATAGGTVSPSTRTAVASFVATSRANGTWSLFRRLNLVCGDFLASFVPLINTVGATQDTNVNLISADYTEASGWKTDGTTKYVRTGFTPDSLGSIGVYLRTTQPSDTNEYMPIGCNNAGYSQVAWLVANRTGTSGTTAGAVSGFYTGPASNAGSGAVAGGMVPAMWHSVRDSTNAINLYKNGANVGSSFTGVTPASTTTEAYVLCRNDGNVPTAFTVVNTQISAYVFDSSMTPTQATNFYTAMQTFQTALGRQV